MMKKSKMTWNLLSERALKEEMSSGRLVVKSFVASTSMLTPWYRTGLDTKNRFVDPSMLRRLNF